jgi:hypothetical protein
VEEKTARTIDGAGGMADKVKSRVRKGRGKK